MHLPTDQPVAVAAWTQTGELAIATWGSGSCPYLVKRLDVVGEQHVRAVIEPIHDHVCTTDFGPTTSVVRAPQGIDSHQPLRIDVLHVELALSPR